MVEMLEADRHPLEAVTKDRDALAEATKQLKAELGGDAEYQKLLRHARTYKPELTEAEKIHRRTLDQYAALGLRNQYKRTGRVDL
jgi:hypothetical protein